jgi:hypothetical protein
VVASRAAVVVALFLALAMLDGRPAAAMGLCDCCGAKDQLTEDCRAACDAAEIEVPMCRPAMVYDGDAGANGDDNALAGASLKFLSMGRPGRLELERFRQWFEKWRSQAEAAFQVALNRRLGGRLGAEDFAMAEARRDAVLVNYQHGMRRYIELLRAGRRKPVTVAAREGGSAGLIVVGDQAVQETHAPTAAP